MPRRPANGARIVFFSKVACIWDSCAFFERRSASSLSMVAWLTACTVNCSRSRFSVVCANSSATFSASTWARSASEFSSTSTAPGATSAPDAKFRRRTSPAISVLTSTPRTARSDPTASIVSCQSWA